jgi:hypothetical protein
MHVIPLIVIALQVYFAVHCVRTGRAPFWIFIIIFFPGIGILIYFFAEYLPDFQQNFHVQRMRTNTQSGFFAKRNLRKLEEQVEITPSANNKKELAEAYVNNGLYDKAISLYESCLEGIHQNDTSLLEGLCFAYFFKGDFANAKIYLEKLSDLGENVNNDKYDLLMAMTLENLNETEKALELYSKIVKTFSGEEARCRYALLLKKIGRNEEANVLFNEILKNARISPRFYTRNQKKWINIAQKELG